MLLLEEQNDNIFIGYYDSSNILLSKYIASERKLSIIFSKGQQYVYENVLQYHYQRFKLGKSQGTSLKEHIINNYAGTKVDFILDQNTLSEIKEKINSLKNPNK